MRVLLVEDEAVLAETLAAGLRADGCVVDVAGNGIDGVAPGKTDRVRRDRAGHHAARPVRLRGGRQLRPKRCGRRC